MENVAATNLIKNSNLHVQKWEIFDKKALLWFVI